MRQKWSFGYLLSFSPFNCHGGTKAENFHGECVQLQIPRSEAFLGFFIPNYQSQVKTEWVSSVASTNRLNHSLILRGPMTGTGLISFTCGPQVSHWLWNQVDSSLLASPLVRSWIPSEKEMAFVYFEKSKAGVKCSYLWEKAHCLPHCRVGEDTPAPLCAHNSSQTWGVPGSRLKQESLRTGSKSQLQLIFICCLYINAFST